MFKTVPLNDAGPLVPLVVKVIPAPALALKNIVLTSTMQGNVPDGDVVPFVLHVNNMPDPLVKTSAIAMSDAENALVFTEGRYVVPSR